MTRSAELGELFGTRLRELRYARSLAREPSPTAPASQTRTSAPWSGGSSCRIW